MSRSNIYGLWSLLALLLLFTPLSAQQEETSCDPSANLTVTQGEMLFNYGSTTNAFSFTNRSSHTVGQPLVGRSIGRDYISESGFWARFLLPPQAPVVQASQGNFPDRVQISWNIDPLSAEALNGFTILRDGAYLDQVDNATSQYIDFNVQAGEFYEYAIVGRNQFGRGMPGKDVGFVNPNGVVTGRLTTFSGNPVANGTVTLEPTIGRSLAFDGVSDYLCLSYNEQLPTDRWTLSTWVKIGDGNDKAGIVDLGSDLNKNFWLHTTASGSGKGVVAGVGNGTTSEELEITFDEAPDDWHHVAVVYSMGTIITYVDGVYRKSMQAAIDTTAALFIMGADRDQSNYFKGNIDDLRIYRKSLTQTDILLTKDITVSSTSNGLVGYWKFDEGLGRNAFDLTPNEIDATIEGAEFDTDNAGVKNAGMTDVAGYYAIEGVNYSEVQTFKAIPQKNFYNYGSLEFNAANAACVELSSFDLPDTATIEISIQPFDLESRQTLLSQGTNFELFLENELFKLTLNGSTQTLGPATSVFQHLALVMDDNTGEVAYYNNGNLVTTLTGMTVAANYAGDKWQLGATGGATASNFYTGLVDEVAFFQGAQSIAEIQIHANPIAGDNVQSGVDAGDGNLLVYFPLDEGTGTEVDDYGPMMTGTGTVKNASFSIIAYRQITSPHEFSPSERIVNLNNSSTAVGNIDFVDNSTVTISGVVRFSNTFCYQDSVELLVNGVSNFPPIFTDSDGRWVGDFEPGASVIMTPRYVDTTHRFSPGFFETRNLSRPIAGVGFQNTTKREVSGQIAGGACRLSINDLDAPVRIKIAALNGCYEQELIVENLGGDYLLKQLPPIPMAVSIVYHPDPTIYDAFQLAGGVETDLREIEKDTINFIHTAPPNVELQAFETLANCPGSPAFIDQTGPKNGYREYTRNVRVFEMYKEEKCYLDTFKLVINNEVADAEQDSVIVSDTTTYVLRFYAGLPNLGGDYTKFIQVVAKTGTGAATATERVVVLGERSRESSFTTSAPAFPMIVLRDPPGDGSSSTIAESSQKCWGWSNASMFSAQDNAGLELDLGAKVITYAGTPFGGIIMENEVVAEVDISGSIGSSTTEENSAEFCVTVDREYSTSDGDAVFGEDADLYVGAAVNFEFSTTDKLEYDYENCEITLDQGFRVWPDGFDTKYVYSQWQLLTDVIPSLEQIGDTIAADAWRRIIAQNKEAKEKAEFVENITFDALNVLTVSKETSSEESSSFTHEFFWSAEMTETVGFEAFGNGQKVSFGFEMEGNKTSETSYIEGNSTTVSYTLADDDPNDNWTVDILDDGVFGTPVFKTRSGETMCPWEPGTLNREQVVFNTDNLNKVNIPANSPAIFNLELTNDSQTGNDPLIYILGTVEGSNPDGAVISVDGEGLTEPRSFQILPGETIEVLMTVERGPEEYSYSDLGVYMASECMWEHSRGLGYDLSDHNVQTDRFGEIIRQGLYDPADLAKFYKEFRIGVEFLEPCSPIGISFPMQDWVVTPTDNNRLSITLVEYIKTDPDLNMIRVQYRPTGGDGSWINIVELAPDDLTNEVFTVVDWDMSELRDGPYDIRAVTECFDLSLNPGISRIVQGRKETKPPELLGTPQPADGVLNPGDEISITFTKRIQCDRISRADAIGTNISYNNLALVDVATGALVDAIITCREDKIVIVPDVANQFIENRTLRVVTNGILDFYGNETSEIAWEFYVNRSNLYWGGGSIDEMVEEGNSLIVTREIRNQGGAITSFNISDIPDWMQVFPRSGSVAPGERLIVNFEFPSDLLPDAYNFTLQMETVDGDEPLEVDLRVLCEGPAWSFEPTQYTFSMNLAVELDIEGVISKDRVDRIGAFVDGELRGLANVQYNQELETDNGTINPYLAFLTVYSNAVSGETVEFQIWDASACELFGSTVESFLFEPDGLIGSPLEPQTIHTDNMVLRKIYIHPGWNWISYNVDLGDSSTDGFMESLTNPDQTSILKGQTQFSQYTPSLDRWLGSLNTVSNTTMYQYRSSAYDSLTLVGQTADPSLPITVNEGWNWLGFLPSRGLAVSDALATLDPLNGDVIKGQFAFAQYVAGVGWIGNLNFMSSPNGYLLRLSNAGVLEYPAPGNLTSDPTTGASNKSLLTGIKSLENTYWDVEPGDFEFSMNLIAVVEDSIGVSLLETGDTFGAMVDGEVRGASSISYVEALDAYLVFLTVYANQEGEALDFLFYDRSADEVFDLREGFAFQINEVLGQVEQPLPFHLSSSIVSNVDNATAGDTFLKVFPNPARNQVFLDFTARPGEKVLIEVHNVYGQQVDIINATAPTSSNLIEWTPRDLPAGLYTITLHRSNAIQTAKIELK